MNLHAVDCNRDSAAVVPQRNLHETDHRGVPGRRTAGGGATLVRPGVPLQLRGHIDAVFAPEDIMAALSAKVEPLFLD
jgi:hypothetical protein